MRILLWAFEENGKSGIPNLRKMHPNKNGTCVGGGCGIILVVVGSYEGTPWEHQFPTRWTLIEFSFCYFRWSPFALSVIMGHARPNVMLPVMFMFFHQLKINIPCHLRALAVGFAYFPLEKYLTSSSLIMPTEPAAIPFLVTRCPRP
mmetsp:Transcript_10836/g.20065  ORF Transcript_10836/g.20065 Transcript_10836/m.20065 type:complete len:147 (-) Transcript_10836:1184-1624(-)